MNLPAAAANEYSSRWFSAFMHTVPEEWTVGESEGVRRRLPLPGFERVLDVCCGTGRHAAHLSREGYSVTGVDRDPEALRRASHAAPGATFLALDQRGIRSLSGPFDAVVVLWQSFGYFDSRTNDQILSDMAAVLRPGGRLLLDLFHPGYFLAEHAAEHSSSRAPGIIIRNRVEAGRLRSRIEYPDGAIETMDFELFDPHVLAARARRAGFHPLEQCCWWEEGREPSPSVQRYQSVFRRA
jgi:SAM-dependent methyltransferase